MRVPEKPASGALLFSAGADRREPLASAQQLALRFTRPLGDFTSFLAPPAASSIGLRNSGSTPAPSASGDISAPQNQTSSSRTADSDSARSSGSSADEETDKLSADDPQPANTVAPPLGLSEPAAMLSEEIQDDAPVSLLDTPDSNESQRPIHVAMPAQAASKDANDTPASATAAAADKTVQRSAASKTSNANDAGQSAANVDANADANVDANVDTNADANVVTPLGQGSAQNAATHSATQPDAALNRQPEQGTQPTMDEGQRNGHQQAAAAPEDDTEIPAEHTELNPNPPRGSRRGASGAARSRDATSSRRSAESSGAPDRATPLTAATAPHAQPIASDAAVAGLSENPVAAPPDAMPLGSQAAVAAATALRPGASEAAGIAASSHDTGSPTAVSAADAADRFGERAAGQRTEEQTRTDIADRARLVHRIAKALTKMGTDGGQVRMRMHPETLGSVLLEMRVRGRSVEARVTAANEASLELLRQQLPDLRQRLENQGMLVQRLDVELHDENAPSNSHPFGDGSPGDGRWSDDRTASRGNRSAIASRSEQNTDTAVATRGHATASLSVRMQPAAPGTLDLSL